MIPAIAVLNLLCAGALTWIGSGSPFPVGLTIALGLGITVSRLVPSSNPGWRAFLLAAPLTLVQIAAFRSGLAGVVTESPPPLYHAAWGLLAWSLARSWDTAIVSPAPGNAPFLASLAGSAALLGADATIRPYGVEEWLIQSIASAPFVLTLAGELARNWPRQPGRRGGLACIFAIPLLAALISQAESGAARLHSAWTARQDSGSGESAATGRPTSTGSTFSDEDGRMLPRHGDIAFRGTTRFYLVARSSADFRRLVRRPLYVRSSTVSQFASDEQLVPLRAGRWLYDRDDQRVDGRVAIAAAAPAGDAIDYAVLFPRRDANQVPLLAGTRFVSAPAIYQFADDWFQLSPDEGVERILLRGEASPPGLYRGEVIAAPSAAPEYTALPDTVFSRTISSLAEDLQGRFPREDAPGRIASFLQDRCQYSLRFGGDRPPLENFLYGERQGHCELFAAASVYLLRTLGIPSRIVFGYTGGEADHRQSSIAFRDTHSHAWAEILLANGEWRVLDPTPPDPSASNRIALPTRLEEIDPALYTDAGGRDEAREHAFSLASALSGAALWMSRHSLLLTAAAGGCFLFLLFLLGARKTSDLPHGKELRLTGSRRAGANRSLASLLGAIEELGAILGQSRSASTTLAEYLDALREAGLDEPILEETAGYVYSVRYAEAERTPVRERALLRDLRRLRRRVRRSASA